VWAYIAAVGGHNPEVDAFLASAGHPRGAEIEGLRWAILDADPGISETVKWRAPNFRYDGVDRVTFRLQPGDVVQLVLHRGPKVRTDSETYVFDDPSGLVEWVTPDRGVVRLDGPADTEDRLPAIVELVRRWVRS
jgi:hypothetical protein